MITLSHVVSFKFDTYTTGQQKGQYTHFEDGAILYEGGCGAREASVQAT